MRCQPFYDVYLLQGGGWWRVGQHKGCTQPENDERADSDKLDIRRDVVEILVRPKVQRTLQHPFIISLRVRWTFGVAAAVAIRSAADVATA